MAVGSAKAVPNGQDTFGGHFFGTVDYSGPSSYLGGATHGDAIDPRIFGFPNTITAIICASVDQSGVYMVVPQPAANGTTAWTLRWFTLVGMTEVTDTTNLSTKTVRLSAIGY
jgi:hypothetical protein